MASLDAIYAMIPKIKTRIALETTAGQGSSLGRTFEELAFILRGCRETERSVFASIPRISLRPATILIAKTKSGGHLPNSKVSSVSIRLPPST